MKTNGESTRYRTIFVVCFLFALLTCFFTYRMYIHPVRAFLIQEIKSEPLFDALNEATQGQLPQAPVGVELTGQSTVGISILHNIHGRLLRLRYSIIDSSLNSDTILRYYDVKMLNKGWKNIPSKYHMSDSVAVAYQQNTGCIRIIMYKKFLAT